MTINPNLVIQLMLSLIFLVQDLRKQGVVLEGKTEDQIKEVLRRMNEEMLSQSDLETD